MQIRTQPGAVEFICGSAAHFLHPCVGRFLREQAIRKEERQAVLDLQHSLRGGNLARAYVAAIRACEAAFVREWRSDHPTIRRARTLAWAGLGLFDLRTWSKALPLLDSYARQADNEGERRLALKAKALVISFIEDN